MATWGGDSAFQRKVLHPAFHLLTKTDTTIGGKFLAPFPIGCNILKVPQETFLLQWFCQYDENTLTVSVSFCLIGWMLFSWGLGLAQFYCHYWISDIWHRVVPSYGFAELSAPSGNWLSGKNSSTFWYRECNFASRARLL